MIGVLFIVQIFKQCNTVYIYLC